MMRYALLCSFILAFSLLYTLVAYCVTHNPWASTFFTAAGALIFVLENMELNKTIRDLEKELASTKQSAQFTLIPKVNDMQQEIESIKAHIEDQAVKEKTRRLRRHGRSCSSL